MASDAVLPIIAGATSGLNRLKRADVRVIGGRMLLDACRGAYPVSRSSAPGLTSVTCGASCSAVG